MVASAETFQILADPVRFQIIELLREGQKSVGEIVQLLSIAQSGVSRHLKILEKHGFVTQEARAQRRVYSLLPEQFIQIESWATEYRALWNHRLDRLEQALTEKQKRKKR